MVDLVKIRKKAKKEKAEEASAHGAEPQRAGSQPQPQPPPPPATAPAAAEQPPQIEVPAAEQSVDTETPATDKLARFRQTANQLRVEADAETEAAEQTTAAAADQLELLTFVIASENYAVDIERIVEIVRPRPITRVPNADATILGIASLRGTIVTLVDVRSRLRHRRTDETADTRVIVVEHAGETIGFEVDRVLRVVKVAPGAVEAHPVVHSSEADESIRGVFRHAGALTILLDFDKLLGPGH